MKTSFADILKFDEARHPRDKEGQFTVTAAAPDRVFAESIARQAHKGQVDKAGVDYIEHVARVVADVPDAAKATAWLHDVIEDTAYTAAVLRNIGIPAPVIEAVVTLTRKSSETYGAYIERVKASGNPLAVAVKIADLRDHLRDEDAIPVSLQKRYEKALERLAT